MLGQSHSVSLPVLIALILSIFVSGHPAQTVAAQTQADVDNAASSAYYYSYLESIADFNTEYDYIHPDARAIIPRAAVVGWFLDNYAPRGPQPATITSVRFIPWTWEVTGVTYPVTAEVSFIQVFLDGGVNTVEEDVVRLVQDDNGLWRWFFGRNREFVDSVISKYVASPPGTTYSGNDLIDGAVNDISQFWNQFYTVSSIPYSEPQVLIFGQAMLSGCGLLDPLSEGTGYCSVDETIYLNPVELNIIEQEFGAMTVTFVIAHEWGHHVQHELGVLGSTVTIELQADCLAGGWARDLATRYGLTEEQIVQAIELMITIGGDVDHGSGTQRTKEFLDGYYDGVRACFD